MASRRLFCPDCTVVRQPHERRCSACGSLRAGTSRWLTPKLHARGPRIKLSGPLGDCLGEIPYGTTISLTAMAGIGKTTLALLTRPGAYILAEQDPDPVREVVERQADPQINPIFFPVDQLDPYEDVMGALASMTTGPGAVTVIDSMSCFGTDYNQPVNVMNAYIQDARATGRIVIFINQTNSQNEVFGRKALLFQPDILINLDQDSDALSRICGHKNRVGSLFLRYYAFDAAGRIITPRFDSIAYSVEGRGLDLELVPYGIDPKGGCKWRGVLDALAGVGVPAIKGFKAPNILPDFAGYASAAQATLGTRSGFNPPRDILMRKAFAEAHGLKWLDLDTALEVLDQRRDEVEDRAAAAEAAREADKAIRRSSKGRGKKKDTADPGAGLDAVL